MQVTPNNLTQQTLCIAAGKSGGHLIPALQLATTWAEKNPTGRVMLCTYGTALDKKIYLQYPIIKNVIFFSFSTFVPYKVWQYPKIAFQGIKACFNAWQELKKNKVSKVITTGGFIALPIAIAAFLLKIPVEAFELNVYPGKALSVLYKIGAQLFVVFKKTQEFLPKAMLTNYPLRFTEQDVMSKQVAQATLNNKITSVKPLTNNLKTIFIAGGSQGSRYINNMIVSFLQSNPEVCKKVQIIHQSGTQEEFYQKIYTDLGIPHVVFNFHEALAACYQAADLVICRAGAGTLFELKFFKQRSIIIPLTTASTNHQTANALAISEELPHLFSVSNQADIDKNPKAFFEKLKKVMGL